MGKVEKCQRGDHMDRPALYMSALKKSPARSKEDTGPPLAIDLF